MKLIKTQDNNGIRAPEDIPEEITPADEEIFSKITCFQLTPEQVKRITTPESCFPSEKSLLAIHWHPEFVPMDVVRRRINAMFPNISESLIIPTQHNVLMPWNEFSGVEVDCYSSGFNQKVQLLLHFKNENLQNADVLKSMLVHTFKYRSSQLFEYIHTITAPKEDWVNKAANDTGSGASLARFARIYVSKIKVLLDRNIHRIPQDAIKNKLIRDFFNELRPVYGDRLINRAQIYLTAVKQIVKANFSNKYFYKTSEIIEEARSLNAGIVIPHPEQFWPILLADYDVDGYEVWNPQSRRYTEFLISVLNEKNKKRRPRQRELLIFMGDDTHMSEKVKDPAHQDPVKASREIGVQTAWDDFSICKQLICANIDKAKVIDEYRNRLMQS
ncbi:MAG: hypothetical protein MUE70_10990 [Desulfobacterales bacterium]|jgi:hypothetical protein|nr:hypothetical protein [Desulfobacterales bacterium]